MRTNVGLDHPRLYSPLSFSLSISLAYLLCLPTAEIGGKGSSTLLLPVGGGVIEKCM